VQDFYFLLVGVGDSGLGTQREKEDLLEWRYRDLLICYKRFLLDVEQHLCLAGM
jgi:hypothetical protein